MTLLDSIQELSSTCSPQILQFQKHKEIPYTLIRLSFSKRPLTGFAF